MYTLFRLHGPRLIRSGLYARSLVFNEHGSIQRLSQSYLRAQSRTLYPRVREISTAVAEARRNADDNDDIQNGFDLLRAVEEEIEAEPDKRASHSTATSFEKLHIWADPLELPKTARELFLEYWKSPLTAKPTDLSYWNVLQGEIEGKHPKAIIGHARNYRIDSHHSPDRALALLFITDYYDRIFSSQGLSDQALSTLVCATETKTVDETTSRIVDLLHYSWVLLAEPSDLVRRFITLARYREDNNLSRMPLWLLLQVLRTRSIDRASLTELIEWLPSRLESWAWKGSSAMILGVRLVRHVRCVPAPDFEAVTAIFLSALKVRFEAAYLSELPLATHWCNRFLSLLAVPAMGNPFRAVRSQQGAQLDVLQFMQEFGQEIHIGREGYRALTRIQLMHEKTASERQWAEAKALTWPPWEERNRMGAYLAPSRYHGQETRALKVLNRMAESGYAPHRAEASMNILAGWDTDKSPTIQVSRIPPHTPRPWEPGPALDETVADPRIWSSRIEATRTVREAWMVFCTCMNSPQTGRSQQYAYQAMHKKLLARKIDLSVNSALLPGDGPETFPDPELARDQVYIPQPIPSVRQLVARMIEEKVECKDSALAYFLDHETLLDTGLALLHNSSVRSYAKQVLSRPREASIADMAEALEGLKFRRLRSSYVKLLARPNVPKSQNLLTYAALQNSDGSSFIWQCILRTKTDHTKSMNSYLEGLAAHLSSDSEGYHRLHVSRVLKAMDDALVHCLDDLTPSFETVRIALYVALAHDLSTERVKQLFVAAALRTHPRARKGNPFPHWVSFCGIRKEKSNWEMLSGDDLENMAWLLASQDYSAAGNDVLALLQLISTSRMHLLKAGVHISKHNLAVFRLFLEESWLRAGFGETISMPSSEPSHTQSIHALLSVVAQGQHYPDDEYMLKYLDYTVHKRHRVTIKILKGKASSSELSDHLERSSSGGFPSFQG